MEHLFKLQLIFERKNYTIFKIKHKEGKREMKYQYLVKGQIEECIFSLAGKDFNI